MQTKPSPEQRILNRHYSHQSNAPLENQFKINQVLIVVAQTVGKILHDLLIEGADPRISERFDANGQRYYQIYDPISEKLYFFDSEDKVRTWLDQRYQE